MDTMIEGNETEFEPGAGESEEEESQPGSDYREPEGSDADPYDQLSPEEAIAQAKKDRAEAAKWKKNHGEAASELTRKSQLLSERERGAADKGQGGQITETQARGLLQENKNNLRQMQDLLDDANAAGGQIEINGNVYTSKSIRAQLNKLSDDQETIRDYIRELQDAPMRQTHRQAAAEAETRQEVSAVAKELGGEKYIEAAVSLAKEMASDPQGLAKILVYAARGKGLPRDGKRPSVLDGSGRKSSGGGGRPKTHNEAMMGRLKDQRARLKR